MSEHQERSSEARTVIPRLRSWESRPIVEAPRLRPIIASEKSAPDNKEQDKISARAQAEVHKDLQSLDISTYRRVLNERLDKLEQANEEAPKGADLSSNDAEIELLTAKQQEVDRLLLDKTVSTPDQKSTDQQFARRQAIEDERQVMRKETTKVNTKITKFNNEFAAVAADRAKLHAWNPFHWGKIRELDNRMGDIKNFLGDLKLRNDELQLRVKKNVLAGNTLLGYPALEPAARPSAVIKRLAS